MIVQGNVVGKSEPLEEHLFCIGSVEIVVLAEEAGCGAGKINCEAHCV